MQNFSYCRVIDFVNETVQTLAGNGRKGSDYQGGGSGTSQARFYIEFFTDSTWWYGANL